MYRKTETTTAALAITGTSWNPFRINATPMPANVLLMCKILALAILATGHFRILPYPYLPFIPFLDQITEPAIFQRTLQITCVVSALALLFNRWVRANALILGSCLLLGVLSSKLYYGNNKTFVGLALVMAGLSDFNRPAYLLRWQFSIVYFGAALNKLLDPDWQSGLFFDYWAGTRLKQPVYVQAAELLPPLVAGKIMCWGTILAEFIIAIGLLVPFLVPLALWVNAFFQIGLLEFTGNTFTLFFYAMQAAALAFIAWPERLQVFTRGENASRRHWLQWFDPDGLQQWKSMAESEYPLGPATHFAVVDRNRIYTGMAARCRLLLYSPVFWLTAAALLAVATGGAAWWRWLHITPAALDWWRRIFVAVVLALVLLAFWRSGKVRVGT